MPRIVSIFCVAASLLLLSPSAHADTWQWITTTDANRWVTQPPLAPTTAPSPQIATTAPSATRPDPAADAAVPSTLTVVIDPDDTAQQIDGFGGCFNEIGWRALLRLEDADRQRVLKSLFDHDGLDFNICRIPIGASDFALSPYSLDDQIDDVELNHFSIDRDRWFLIPYIKAALAIRPDLRFWGSPWSPPAWMKNPASYHGGQIRHDPQIYKAYANYLARFVEEYHREGINVIAVDVQNEPGANTKYPSCIWPDATIMRDFIRDFAGPIFAQRNVPARLWLGTINHSDYDWMKTILDDPAVEQTIGGVGLQYGGRFIAARLHRDYPDLTLWQTETMCFGGRNSWSEAEETFRQMLIYFRGGVSAYMYWNMVLDQTGLSSWAWSQDSTIVVNASNGNAVFTPQFYLMKHLSSFVKPGSVFLKPGAQSDPALAFKTPDGAVVVVLVNTNRNDRAAEIYVGTQMASVTLPAKSFSTFVCR